MKNIILNILFLILLNITGFTQEVNSCYSNITCEDFYLYLETKEVLVIDVRLMKEYRKERIESAMLATDLNALKELLTNYDKDINILIYCEEGNRSKIASQFVCSELNFKHVYNLKRGLKDWERKSYPIDRKTLKNDEN